MKTDSKIPKLLSPAGSPESLKAAVNSGADAVYLGARQFSARERAVNFTEAEMAEAIDYCHLRGVEVYAAVNILYKNAELRRVLELIRSAAEMGADAFILQDIGLTRIVKEMWPDINLHASTQMTVSTPEDAGFLARAGFSRAVLGRELSFEQIRKITMLNVIETEVFIHGALCVGYSGQCLMSAKLGGRGGNRGQCAQPCRLPYTLTENGSAIAEGYLLSPRDLMTIDMLQEIIDTGIDCLKIEGRMKDAVYTAAVTAEYRRVLDGGEVDVGAEKRLNQVFNRGGSSVPGYFAEHAGRDMISAETPKNTGVLAGRTVSYDSRRGICVVKAYEPFSPGDGLEIWTRTEPRCGAGVNVRAQVGDTFTVRVKGDIRPGDPVYKTNDKALEDSIKRAMIAESRKRVVTGLFYAKADEPAVLELRCNGVSVKSFSDVPQPARTVETNESEIKRRLSKTGGSAFTIEWERFEAEEELFFPVSALNDLRRRALTQMEEAIINKHRRVLEVKRITPPRRLQTAGRKRIHVSVARADQLEAALNGGADRIILEPSVVESARVAIDICHVRGAELFLALPLAGVSDVYAEPHADGYYARSWGHILSLADAGRPVIADYTIQAYNRHSIGYITNCCQGLTLSAEMDLTEAEENACSGSELIV
ncbi:MAG: U32 family peptidase, partial [Clostridiales bacterium]|nr:U32 family peptidase [Clostridiales bacterium]